ncbi:MAG: hypothetical protein Q4C12_01240 [Clostridia bacterium]|nr:hypothetical protein [Clostridia bacterium]
MITKLRIDKVNIEIRGIDNPLWRERVAQYLYPFEKSNIVINYKERDFIPRPAGETVGTVDRRTWLRTRRGYSNFDYIRENDEGAIARIDANEDFSEVDAYLTDIREFGGVDNSIRSFNMMGEIYRNYLLCHEGVIIHASAILTQGDAIAFSAPSGTGKSTHTQLWQKYVPGVKIINDDSPSVRFIGKTALLSGTPWSGKSDINTNVTAPLKAIVFLRQAAKINVSEIPRAEAAFRIISQTPVPLYDEMTDMLINSVERLLDSVPMYLLECDVSPDAVKAIRDRLFN